MGGLEGVGLTTSSGNMSGEGGEKAAEKSYSLEVLLAAMLGGGRGEAKPVPHRLLAVFETPRRMVCHCPTLEG